MPDLARFITAQDPVYAQVLREIVAGDKASHWMWFIFPQLRALGFSQTAKHFGLADLAEAAAYCADATLGTRLVECCRAMQAHHAIGAVRVLGDVDAMKWRSCLTLFACTPQAPPLFGDLIDQFYDGVADPKTLALLQISPASGELGSA